MSAITKATERTEIELGVLDLNHFLPWLLVEGSVEGVGDTGGGGGGRV